MWISIPFGRAWPKPGFPFVLHVGGAPLQLARAWMNNGRPATKDWLGGGENLRTKDIALLHEGPEAFLTMLVLDGVLERHPGLRGACVELGAGWVPELLRRLDWVVKHWSRNDANLQGLSRIPSRQMTDQLAFTPFVFEEVGNFIDQSNPDLYLFSSDYPHIEGGRDPIGRFEGALGERSEAVRAKVLRRQLPARLPQRRGLRRGIGGSITPCVAPMGGEQRFHPPSPSWGGTDGAAVRVGQCIEAHSAVHASHFPTPAFQADPPHKGEGGAQGRAHVRREQRHHPYLLMDCTPAPPGISGRRRAGRAFQAIAAGRAGQNLQADHLGRRAAVRARQAGDALGHVEARAAALRALAEIPPHQVFGRPPDRLHPGGITVSAHVRLHKGRAAPAITACDRRFQRCLDRRCP